MRIRFDILQMAHEIRKIKREYVHERPPAYRERVQAEQRQCFNLLKAALDEKYSKDLHPSRPYDWLCLKLLNGMLTKLRMQIDHPFCQTSSKNMPAEERYDILQTSVTIICDTHELATDPRVRDWAWFFRGYVQWHSLAIVVAELGHRTTQEFADKAWTVLDPLLANWDSMFVKRKEDPAWHHVNTLIQRAKSMRRQQPAPMVPAHKAHQPVLAANGDISLPPVQQLSTPMSLDANMESSSLADLNSPQASIGLDNDFGTIDFNDIDFDAFDTVFGCTDWEFLDPLPDLDSLEPSS